MGATAIVRLAMAGKHDLDAHFGGALHEGVGVIHLEPEQHTIAVGLAGAIADVSPLARSARRREPRGKQAGADTTG
jgi:hypothetical protein